jgi:hypothetical protein
VNDCLKKNSTEDNLPVADIIKRFVELLETHFVNERFSQFLRVTIKRSSQSSQRPD